VIPVKDTSVKILSASIGALVLFLVFCAGCTSSPATVPTGNSVVATPVPTNIEVVTLAATNVPSTGTAYQTYTNPTYQFTMSYPADWQVNEISSGSCMAARDYGRTTCNVVNFFSPTAADGTYQTFSVDVDSPTTLDLEDYFNKATGALENYYPGLHVTQAGFQLKVSDIKAYELEFQKGGERSSAHAVEVITIADNKVPYIFTYNSMKDPALQDMLKSIRISATSAVTKQR